ncbi:hypothetical protein D8Y20_06915 [Mariprofundus sp. EBB-1]|nr:hypothetical protein D8Y20_06915 [Mariprofundus sp. EBB-1]
MRSFPLLFSFLLLITPMSAMAEPEHELDQIAKLIFQNECASKNSCLTSWNEGEEFASLGIGHFIWYPGASNKTFSESFPALLLFMQQQGEQLPAWLAAHPEQANPWSNRETFLAAYDGKKMHALRDFLIRSKATQATFMQQRLRASLPLLLKGLDQDAQQHIRQQFERVASSPMGMYVLMDYVNFKGEGTSLKERYQGKGWGLLQVLQYMSSDASGIATIKAFADAADAMLTRRVHLSPPERNEARWLSGWRKRLHTYVHEAEKPAQ